MSDAARTAYLFRCRDEDLFGVTLDETGANLPLSMCTEGWLLRQQFELGVREEVPAPIMPERILIGILASGYYIWRGWSGPSERPVK